MISRQKLRTWTGKFQWFLSLCLQLVSQWHDDSHKLVNRSKNLQRKINGNYQRLTQLDIEQRVTKHPEGWSLINKSLHCGSQTISYYDISNTMWMNHLFIKSSLLQRSLIQSIVKLNIEVCVSAWIDTTLVTWKVWRVLILVILSCEAG